MFEAFRRRRAARLCATRLPALLHQGYGAREFYTPAQIAAAAGKAGLAPQYLAIAYAAFLPEPVFRQVSDGDYAVFRALFERYRETLPAYGIEPAREHPNAVAGLGGSGGPIVP